MSRQIGLPKVFAIGPPKGLKLILGYSALGFDDLGPSRIVGMLANCQQFAKILLAQVVISVELRRARRSIEGTRKRPGSFFSVASNCCQRLDWLIHLQQASLPAAPAPGPAGLGVTALFSVPSSSSAADFICCRASSFLPAASAAHAPTATCWISTCRAQ